MTWKSSTLFIVVFSAISLYANKVEITPYLSTETLEFEYFVIAFMSGYSDLHPLLGPIYRPLAFLLPFDLLNSEIVHIISAYASIAIPPTILLFIMRGLGLSPLTSLAIVVVTWFSGRYGFDAYTLKPNPFTIYDSSNFRMLMPTAFAGIIYFLIKRRWVLAGLCLTLASASHPKFGVRLCELLAFIFVVLHFFPGLLPSKQRISWGDASRFFGIFAVTFAPLAYDLVKASGYFNHLDAPRADGLISPLGWLIKNEPDDWLFLYMPDKSIAVALVLGLVTIMACAWATFRLRQSNPTLAAVGAVGLLANCFALFMHVAEIAFEQWGLSQLPWKLTLTLILTRAWDFLWVAPLTVAIVGVLLAFHYLASKRFFHHALIICTIISAITLLVPLVSAEHKDRLTVQNKFFPKAFADYSVLTVCSADGGEHAKAKADALVALRNGDSPGFQAALTRMRAIFSNVARDLAVGPGEDIEADTLAIVYAMRQGDYSGAFALLRRQDERIRQLSPDSHPWSGDVAWLCQPGQRPGTYWQVVNQPWNDYEEALGFLTKEMPADTGLFQLPSASMVIAWTKRAAFWETAFDSHAMYMYPTYYGIGLNRLNALAGEGALETSPGYRFGDPRENGRTFFLSRTAEDFARLQAKYPNYKYILTEVGHNLPFPRLYSNATFVVYACCQPEAAGTSH